jgi:ganglioside-induced differentiation-associated protein 1
MGITVSASPEVRALRGFHLYHFRGSNSSQKVRICLDEKGIAWTSHPIDLERSEHVAPAYLAVNPKGQVPALVHDGTVIVESNDIIDYLDRGFPDPPLRPADPMALDLMYRWLALWDTIQFSLKALSYASLFGQRAAEVKGKFANYETALSRRNDELLEFLREFISEEGLSAERIEAAGVAVDNALAKLDVHLRAYEWLAGDAFSLADIAWAVDVRRFELIGFRMDEFEALALWYASIKERPSFRRIALEDA